MFLAESCVLKSDMAGQVYRSWNDSVKLVWDLPRSTHNYSVKYMLSEDIPSVTKRILTQYVGFLQRLEKSVCKEVRIMKTIQGFSRKSINITRFLRGTNRDSFEAAASN